MSDEFEPSIPKGCTPKRGEYAHVWDDSWLMHDLPSLTHVEQDTASSETPQKLGETVTKHIREEWS